MAQTAVHLLGPTPARCPHPCTTPVLRHLARRMTRGRARRTPDVACPSPIHAMAAPIHQHRPSSHHLRVWVKASGVMSGTADMMIAAVLGGMSGIAAMRHVVERSHVAPSSTASKAQDAILERLWP